MEVSLEAAYREACQALGEAVVRERLMAAQLQQLAAAQDVPAQEPTPERA